MPENVKTAAGYLFVCFIWGSTWLAIRLGLDSLTPFYSASFRFSVAAVTIGLLTVVNKYPIPLDAAAKRLYLQMGFLSLLIPFGLVYWAEQYVASGLAAVLFSVYPFAIALISAIRIKEERVNAATVAGMVTAFGGIIVIFSNDLQLGGALQAAGMGAIVLSAVMQAAIAVSIKKEGKHLHPVTMNLVPVIIGALGSLAAGFFWEDFSANTFHARSVASFLYLGVFGTVITFTTYYWLMKRIPIVLLALIAFITPVIALLLGWLAAGESFTARHLAGSALVLSGIIISNFQLLRNRKQ